MMTSYFTVTRELNAPREKVFDVLTTPEHFSQWFGTRDLAVPNDSLVMDVSPGGEFRAVMLLPDGNRINWTGNYVEVDRPKHLAMTLSDSPEHDPGVPVVFDLQESTSGSVLTIRQERGDFSDEQVDATIAGYDSFIDEIAVITESL